MKRSTYAHAHINEFEYKKFAPGEARTHGLQIMRLTRCLLRYGGIVLSELIFDYLAIIGRLGNKQNMLYPRGDSNPQSSV